MKKLLLVAAALASFGLAAPASAADLAARPAPYAKAPAMIATVYDWSGFYIGANGGYGWSHKCWDQFFTPTVLLAEGCHDASGGVAGGQIGYRWQAGSWVFGVEGQGDWANLKGRNVSILTPQFTNESRINAIGLLTGQVGYAFNNVLVYVKGGAAVTDDSFRSFVTATNALATNVVSDTRWGGVVGAGVEFGFTPNWSVGFEYDHLFMGNRNYTFLNNGVAGAAGTLFSNERIRQDVDMVTVRVNYRWGGPVIAKY